MLLYLLRNRITEKVYVGITTRTADARFDEHIAASESARPEFQGRYLYRAMRKYGVENWAIEEIATASSLAELKEMEIEAIALFRSNDRRQGYNSTLGGDGITGHTHSTETRAKLSLAHSGRKLPASTIEKLRALHDDPAWSARATAGIRAYRHPPEFYRKLGDSQRGKKRSPEICAKMSVAMKGKPKTAEHTANSVASRLAMNFKKTPEQKEKSARFHRGRKRLPETGQRISAALKIIYSTRPKRDSPNRDPERDAEIMAHYYHSRNMRMTGVEFGITAGAVHAALERCRREYEQRLQAASRLYADHVAPRVIPSDFLGYAFGGFQ